MAQVSERPRREPVQLPIAPLGMALGLFPAITGEVVRVDAGFHIEGMVFH